MLCIHCKKNQATKTYERLKNGKKEMEYYCLSCYRYAVAEQEDLSPRSACPYCGTTIAELKKRNLVGCAQCYTTLAHALQPTIQKMQGATSHVGARPFENDGNKKQMRILELRTLAEKCYAENDDAAAARYESQMARLIAGEEEEYVWNNRLLSEKL